MRAVLNVGGGSKTIPIPDYYAGWRHDLLDIDPAGNPEIVMDARGLQTLSPAIYDAIYCANNLEHYSFADGQKVIAGFKHVLKADGFVEVRVPDLVSVMKYAAANNLDLDDELYDSPSGPIRVRDTIYGYQLEIERSGNDFYAHKNGFSPKSLVEFFKPHGFRACMLRNNGPFEVTGYFFMSVPSAGQQKMLNFVHRGG